MEPARRPPRSPSGWNGRRLLAISAAAVVLAASIGLLALQRRDVPPAGASELVVPSVEGLQVEQATPLLHRAGFEVRSEEVRGATPGEVVDQSPDPGPYAGTTARVTRRVEAGVPEPAESTTTGPVAAHPSGRTRGHHPASRGKGPGKAKHGKAHGHGNKHR